MRGRPFHDDRRLHAASTSSAGRARTSLIGLSVINKQVASVPRRSGRRRRRQPNEPTSAAEWPQHPWFVPANYRRRASTGARRARPGERAETK